MESSSREKLFRELYDSYSGSMYRIAYSVLRDVGYAEDAVQQTFIKLFNEIDNLTDIHSNKTRAFIVILIRNTAIDIYRKRRREQVIYFEDLEKDPTSMADSPEQVAIDHQTEERLRVLFGSMGEKYAEILTLRYLNGYRNKDIAGLLGMTEAAVASRVFQAKRLLTKRLEQGA